MTVFLFRFLCCSSEAELWDWVTSFLKAQVSHLLASCLAEALSSLLRSSLERRPGSPGDAPPLSVRNLQTEVRHDAAGSDQRSGDQQQHAVSQSDAGQSAHLPAGPQPSIPERVHLLAECLFGDPFWDLRRACWSVSLVNRSFPSFCRGSCTTGGRSPCTS